ncbi:MAG: hypothetical protein KKC79_04680, partial [Gammaproteobacteria bacterium]|nr:hypothetical protein [Gammaproteobacteria bacterium]
MPASIATAADVDAFDSPFLLDWTDHPSEGPLTHLACLVNRQLARYLFDEATIEIDIGGPQMSI